MSKLYKNREALSFLDLNAPFLELLVAAERKLKPAKLKRKKIDLSWCFLEELP